MMLGVSVSVYHYWSIPISTYVKMFSVLIIIIIECQDVFRCIVSAEPGCTCTCMTMRDQ